jgi:hypothetical protein
LSEFEKRNIRDKEAVKQERPTRLKQSLSMIDESRCIEAITVDPSGRLAAASDRFGRVLLFDLVSCACVRIWKGFRGAQCGWLQYAVKSPAAATTTAATSHHKQQQQQRHSNQHSIEQSHHVTLLTFLVIHAPRRGLMQIWRMLHGGRESVFAVPATVSVPHDGAASASSGCTLLTTAHPIGSSKPLDIEATVAHTSGSVAKLTRCYYLQWNQCKAAIHEITLAQPRAITGHLDAHHFELQELESFRELPVGLLSVLDQGISAEMATQPQIFEQTQEKILAFLEHICAPLSSSDATARTSPPPPSATPSTQDTQDTSGNAQPFRVLGLGILMERLALGQYHSSLQPAMTAEFLQAVCNKIVACFSTVTKLGGAQDEALHSITGRINKLQSLLHLYKSACLQAAETTSSHDTNGCKRSISALQVIGAHASSNLPPLQAPTEHYSSCIQRSQQATQATFQSKQHVHFLITLYDLVNRTGNNKELASSWSTLNQTHRDRSQRNTMAHVGQLLFGSTILESTDAAQNNQLLALLMDTGKLQPKQIAVCARR